MTEFPQHANCEAGNQTQKGLSGQKSLQSSNLLRNSFFFQHSPAFVVLSGLSRTLQNFCGLETKGKSLSIYMCGELGAERRNRKGSKFNVPVAQHIPGSAWICFLNGENRGGVPQQSVLSCCWLILPLPVSLLKPGLVQALWGCV